VFETSLKKKRKEKRVLFILKKGGVLQYHVFTSETKSRKKSFFKERENYFFKDFRIPVK
jgi:hypothetical protein